jgi:predicted DNA-binding transcriptional regulator AlpA
MLTRTKTEPQATKPKRGTLNPQPLHAAQIADALLTLKTAGAVAGLSASTVYRKAASDPTFPKLIRMGKRCTRIRAGDLTAWLAAQVGA